MEVKQDSTQLQDLYKAARIYAAQLDWQGKRDEARRLYSFSNMLFDVMTKRAYGISFNSK